MLGQTWYFGLIRKYVTIFGTLFNDILINRVDSSDNTTKTIKVPIAYGPKERYLTRQSQNDDLLRPISLVYPRMAFEITDIRYDSDRKLSTIGKSTTGSSDKGNLHTQNNPVPYNISFRLSIIARNSDDALRIVEQIIPYFTPNLNVSANLIAEMNYGNITLPLTLNDVGQEELYEGDFTSKEYIIWTLDFTLKAFLYGPTNESKVIKEIFVNFKIPDGDITTSAIATTETEEHIYIRPGKTAGNTATSNAAASVAVANINSTDAYGFIVEYIRDADA
jgi:T4-like virus Myoviridae tail sheath stabiliser